MAAKPVPARSVEYSSLDALLEDVEGLLANGYTAQGNWSLGQAADHVAEWMRYPMDGFPTPPFFIRMIFSLMKITGATKKMANRILTEGFRPGMPTDPKTVADASVSDADGVAKLKRVVEQLQNHSGSFHPSPLFGPMGRAEAEKVALLHAAHHFRFLAPN